MVLTNAEVPFGPISNKYVSLFLTVVCHCHAKHWNNAYFPKISPQGDAVCEKHR